MCIPRIKFFMWLLLHDRVNTRNVLSSRNKYLEEGYACPMFHDNVEETTMHLFFECSFGLVDGMCLVGSGQYIHDSLFQVIIQLRSGYSFMAVAWCIWKERNDLVFNDKVPSITS